MKTLHKTLTDNAFKRGLKHLSSVDPDLAKVIKEIGPPPMWEREPGFPTLVHIILEQQVSLASARAAFNKLLAAARPLTPERFLEFDDNELKEIGFSRQKAAYCRSLAQAILDGEFNLDGLHQKDDFDARSEMIKIKGIGPWTADIYLLMALRRPNIWPGGDLALVVAIQKVKNLELRPTPQQFQALGEMWHPWRAVAARILWHYYLTKPAPAK